MENIKSNSTTRFSDKVDNYIKYRPHYPEDVISFLKIEEIINKDTIIADIGSGTGISTELFLPHVKKVFAIEPNNEMRIAGEKLLSHHKNFESVNATAEETTLPDNSIDVIAAGQAFHWFDIDKFRNESKRILKPNGYVILMWNVRKLTGTPFLDDYEKLLLKYGTDYIKVRHEGIGQKEKIQFYGDDKFISKKFYNEQVFDYTGMEGRLLSSSYIPRIGEPGYDDMLRKLKEVFEKHHRDGKIKVVYDTEVYVGKLKD